MADKDKQEMPRERSFISFRLSNLPPEITKGIFYILICRAIVQPF